MQHEAVSNVSACVKAKPNINQLSILVKRCIEFSIYSICHILNHVINHKSCGAIMIICRYTRVHF